MKKTSWLLKALVVLLAVSGLGSLTQVQAADTGNSMAVPLSLDPIQNRYQINKNTYYYDLQMKPNTETKLGLKLANSGDKPLTVQVQAIAARTSDQGQAIYTSLSTNYDSSLKYPLPTLIDLPEKYQKITIPAHQTATYSLPLKMPAKQFKGVILGALLVRPNLKTAAKSGITNKYAYSIAVQLTNGIDETPDLRLNTVKVQHDQVQTNVLANLQNYKAALVRKGTIAARITKQGQNRTLKSLAVNRSSMAPNSNFDLKIPWGAGAIAPGDYTLHLTYTSQDPLYTKAKTWQFTKNFHVSALEAAQLTLQALHIPWWVYLILFLILIALIVLIVILIKRRKGGKARDKDA
ncbi:DUF916 and DUF3324 domain-containing protein [Lacticaseibacillus mingshuiensis]|uniref:DUF916 and DUF3324 domain-containing protein n=1 Tax=Lacticaseibacillus mingshuiensis TaxID=2799574 RepID=UPI001951DAAB|nr:DUF916 and DUF3324 domain-containing protein [Lacticaseibacillus mingshuiensis]